MGLGAPSAVRRCPQVSAEIVLRQRGQSPKLASCLEPFDAKLPHSNHASLADV